MNQQDDIPDFSLERVRKIRELHANPQALSKPVLILHAEYLLAHIALMNQAAPPVAAPGASIDSPEFRNMMLEYALLSHQPPYLERIFAHIDTHAAQHGERRAEEVAAHQQNHIEELKAQLAGEQSLATVAMKERDALQASLARLVEGVEKLRAEAPEYMKATPNGNHYRDGYKDALHDVRSIIAILPAKADKPKGCTGTPACCPDNEGYGCHCTPIQGDDHA